MSMAPSLDSMFLIEIVVEDFKTCIDKKIIIKSQFADLFSIDIKYPNETRDILIQTNKKRSKRETKFRSCDKFIENPECLTIKNKVKICQIIIIAYNIDLLISNMQNYDLEISIWRAEDLDLMGLAHIPWSQNHIDFLKKVCEHYEPNPVSVNGRYNIVDKLSLKQVATLKLNVKLRHLRDKITCQFNSLSDNAQHTHSYTLPTNNMKTTKYLPVNGTAKTNMKTLCNDKKCIVKNNGPLKLGYDPNENVHSDFKPLIMTLEKEKNVLAIAVDKINDDKKRTYEILQSVIHLINSHTTIDENKKLGLIKSKSLSKVSQKVSNNIFGGTGPYSNHVYCVAYFTVENDFTKSTCSTKSESSINNRKEPPKADDRILIDLNNLKKQCCGMTEEVEEVVGDMKANMNFGSEPCMCTCECKFGFTKNTVYCTICGGYENLNEDNPRKAGRAIPFPCPIFHKLLEKKKSKTLSTSGSDNKKKTDDNQKTIKAGSKSEKKTVSEKNPESEKYPKKVDRFKFNYGYKAPQIGHSHCASPCTGVLGVVPKNVGWLWNSEDVPGMKFRPNWKPGATSKHVVRLLKIAKTPGKSTTKKRRKDGGKMKRPLKRPLLTIHKKDGEITVTMERTKAYSKQRTFNQYPYEDKPVLTYTIGRTDEENRQRQIKKERKQRRLERAQRLFIQSAFKNMCQEVCLKTYQQALGILPNTEALDCLCYPIEPDADITDMNVSCSCSEDKSTSGTDTDLDEWIVEFTPPNATFYPTLKVKKVSKIDNSTQYTYLDYKVKLLDKSGNPVPRFFTGPDGKQKCSDIGGFWSPDKKWLTINIDGYIGPDNRWAPKLFFGPSGEPVDCETGKFQDTNGTWLTVGVDGFINCQGKWQYYRKPTKAVRKSNHGNSNKSSDTKKISHKHSEVAWSCFGDVTPGKLSKIGILGHGHDKRLLLDTLREMQGPQTVLYLPGSKRKKRQKYVSPYSHEKTKCKHLTPSDKGIVAVDQHGNKAYFRLRDYKNRRPHERLACLTKQGISLNSFHLPCFRSFINSEIMKKQLHEKLQARYEISKRISQQVLH